jgi:hypothetical protein
LAADDVEAAGAAVACTVRVTVTTAGPAEQPATTAKAARVSSEPPNRARLLVPVCVDMRAP